MSLPHVVILGAGPAGLGAAFQLARRGAARATVLERGHDVGGAAGSFELAGMSVDYGSHRLHPSCDPRILADLRALLGDDLLDRPRHGRIRLSGRWIHFPLRPLDLLLRLPPRFVLGIAGDMAARPWRRPRAGEDTFAWVLETGLGRTICRDFYFPYAQKVWGHPAWELAAVQARRRVRAGTVGRLARKVADALPGVRRRGAGRFHYPRGGYGQISQALRQAAEAAGARIECGAVVRTVECAGDVARGVTYEREDTSHTMAGDHVWSTIPAPVLVRALRPAAPPAALAGAAGLEFRAMILVYLVLAQSRFTEYDAHYFPEADIAITRLSEPKNYSLNGPTGQTVLCAELPCATTDSVWSMSDEKLAELVCAALYRAGLGIEAPIKETLIRRLPNAYPIYRSGYEASFRAIDDYLDTFSNVVSFGRQGLFAHDNTHHALFMAYSAVDCLGADGGFDRSRWHGFRRVFETHVVED